ncbi:hypothetical protein BHE74_00025088, partial [Ensete ventricosum]
GTEVWEIDFQQLNFGNKVASGSHGDLSHMKTSLHSKQQSAWFKRYARNTCGSFSFYSLQGLRPTIPKNAHPKLAELMENCWQQNPTDRPDFSEILHILQLIAKEVFHQTLNLCAQISYFSLKKSFWLIGFELSNRWEKNPTIGSWNIHQVGFSPFLDRGR